MDLWQDRWDKADVIIGGDSAAQQGIRYKSIPTFGTYYGEDEPFKYWS